MLLCLHDEHAVHIAQGYWKASDRMMAAALHSNGPHARLHADFQRVGDRTPHWCWARRAWTPPNAARGSTDPHSSPGGARAQLHRGQSTGTVAAAAEALVRAAQIAQTAPRGPVYVNLDVTLQEEKIAALPLRHARHGARARSNRRPNRGRGALAVRRETRSCRRACSRSVESWNARGARRETEPARAHPHQAAAAFPTDHRCTPRRPQTGCPRRRSN